MKNRIDNFNDVSKSQTNNPIIGFHPLQVLVRRRWQLFASLLLVSCIALVSAFVYKPSYEAVAQVQVVPQGSEEITNPALAAIRPVGAGDYFTTQCELIKSQHILAQVANRLSPNGDTNKRVNQLRKQIIVRPVAGSHLIDIVAMADNKSEAAAIANQLVSVYVDTSMAIQKTNDKRIMEKVNSQTAKYDKDVQLYENELHEFRKSHSTTDATRSLAMLEARVATMENDYNLADLACITLKNKSEEISKYITNDLGSSGPDPTLKEVTTDSILNELKVSMQTLRRQEVKLSQAYLPGHRKLVSVRLQLSGLKGQHQQRKQKVLQTAQADTINKYNAQLKQKESLAQLIKFKKQEGIELAKSSRQYESIGNNLLMANKVKGNHATQLQQILMEQEMAESPVIIVDPARVPTSPTGLSSGNRSASILLIGILFSVAFVLSIDRFSVNENSDMNAQNNTPWLNAPVMVWPNGQQVGNYPMTSPTNSNPQTQDSNLVLGRICDIPFSGSPESKNAFAWRSRIVHLDQQNASAAAFRNISSKLLGRFGQAKQSVVLTGTSRNSGKTTCASNLALMLAQAGRKVVIVDSDSQNSSLQRVFQIKKAKMNIADYDNRSQTLDSVIQKTDIDNLYTMQVDTARQNQLANTTATLAALNNELLQHFDWVIYDAGTIGCKMTDQLLQVVGKALFVSSDDDTHGKLYTVEQIEHRGAINIGCVENAHNISQTQSQAQPRQMAFS